VQSKLKSTAVIRTQSGQCDAFEWKQTPTGQVSRGYTVCQATLDVLEVLFVVVELCASRGVRVAAADLVEVLGQHLGAGVGVLWR
jgi:hypothetical protein